MFSSKNNINEPLLNIRSQENSAEIEAKDSYKPPVVRDFPSQPTLIPDYEATSNFPPLPAILSYTYVNNQASINPNLVKEVERKFNQLHPELMNQISISTESDKFTAEPLIHLSSTREHISPLEIDSGPRNVIFHEALSDNEEKSAFVSVLGPEFPLDADDVYVTDDAPKNTLVSLSDKIINNKFLLFNLATVIFYGMLAHDFIMFETLPDERYGTTLKDVFLGLPISRPNEFGYAKSNKNTLLNHLGSDKVTDLAAFWSPVVTLIVLPIIETTVKYIFDKNEAENINEEEISLSKNILKRSFKVFSKLLIVYAYVRYLSLLLQKMEETNVYTKNKIACEDEGKSYAFNDEIADFICSIGGDWNDLHLRFNQINNPQQCFDALIANASNKMLSRIDRLKKFNIFHNIDFSNTDINKLDDQLFANFLQKISELHLKIEKFDVSNTSNTNSPLGSGKISAIINFLHDNHLNTFQILNQIILKDNLNLLIEGFSNTHINSLNLSSMKLKNEEAENLRKVVTSIKNLQEIILSNNLIGDASASNLIGNLPPRIKVINLDNNKLSHETLKAFNNTQLVSISLAGMQNGHTRNLNDLGKIISSPKNNYLNIRNNGLNNNQFLQLAPYFGSSTAIIDISDNELNTMSAANAFFARASKKLPSLNLSGTNIPNDAGLTLQNYLTGAEIIKLNFANNFLNTDSFEKFLNGVFASSIQFLDISNNQLSDSHIEILINLLLKNPEKLKFIKLSENQIGDDSGVKLINAMSVAKINCFDISGNQITDKSLVALKTILPDSYFKDINISNNAYSSNALVNVLSVKHSTLERFAANGISLNRAQLNKIAGNLIELPYDLSYINNLNNEKLSPDQKRALHNAHSTSNLNFISLDSSADTSEISDLLDKLSIVENFPQLCISLSNYDPTARNLLSLENDYSPNLASDASVLRVGECGAVVLMLYIFYQLLMKRWQQSKSQVASQGYRNHSIYSRSNQTQEIDLEANISHSIKNKK